MDVLRRRPLLAASLVALSFQAATNASLLLCILLLQDVQHESALHTGLAFAPMNLSISIASVFAAHLLRRVAPALLMGAGLALIGMANLLLIRVELDSSYRQVLLPSLLLIGVGIGTAAVAATATATAAVPQQDRGLAGGLVNTAGELGFALGLGLFVSIATMRTQTLSASGTAEGASILGGYRAAFVSAAIFSAASMIGALSILGRSERRSLIHGDDD